MLGAQRETKDEGKSMWLQNQKEGTHTGQQTLDFWSIPSWSNNVYGVCPG